MVKKSSKNSIPGQESNSDRKETNDNLIYYALAFIILLLFAVIFVPKLFPRSQLTIEELHQKNLQGKLPPDKGYVYNGYSFVFYDRLWHTQMQVQQGGIAKQYNMHFHFSPRDIEHIIPQGSLNRSNLNRYKNFFMTFNPLDEDLAYIAASISESNFVFIQVFGKGVIASCTNNESPACFDRPIVQCNSTTAPVFYFASEEETSLLYLNNCVVMAGKKEELFKAADRMLFDLLGIMS